MRGFLLLCLCLPLVGCIAGAQEARSSTTVTRDTQVPGFERTTYDSVRSGSYIGGQFPIDPIVMNGGGFGGGAVYIQGSAGGILPMHNDERVGVYQTTLVQPTYIVSSGGGKGGPGGKGGSDSNVESSGDPELDAFLKKHEEAISAIVGQLRQSTRQQCQILIANPKVIPDLAEQKAVVPACEAYLAKHPYQTKENR